VSGWIGARSQQTDAMEPAQAFRQVGFLRRFAVMHARHRSIRSRAAAAPASSRGAAATIAAALGLALACAVADPTQAAEPRTDSYLEREADIATQQPGPHEGEGLTTAFPFFEQAEGFDIVFRKRALHPGASIGEHRNDKDEIYYVLSGRGELMLDGDYREVGAGDAILTRRGSTHGLRQRGEEDLVIFVVFRKPVP
jgi:quercetin dioxygenase-like cupin family protein